MDTLHPLTIRDQSKLDATTLALFSGVMPEPDEYSAVPATTIDVLALALEYNYCLTPELIKVVDGMNGRGKGHFFMNLGNALQKNLGQDFPTAALHRDFPHHTVLPMEYRWVCTILSWMGVTIKHDPKYFGADPVTGFQSPEFGPDMDYDAQFTCVLDKSAAPRKMRFIKLLTPEILTEKACAMMSNLTPLSAQETAFIVGSIRFHLIDAEKLAQVKFREKLPLLWGHVNTDDYFAMCNSVTDVMRLAVHMSGGTDLSLNTKTKFKINKPDARDLMNLLECVIYHKKTDYATDLLRHKGPWKALARHIRYHKFAGKYPHAANALKMLETGNLLSWQSKYVNSPIAAKIALAMERPGVFVRDLVHLTNLAVDSGSEKNVQALSDAFDVVLPQVDCLKLIQLWVHLGTTVHFDKRYHMLPKGTILSSQKKKMPTEANALTNRLEQHLRHRLHEALPWSWTKDLDSIFVPVANRAASSAASRTSRGDKTKLGYETTDTVRFFLHWHHPCDVDISAVFFNDELNKIGECTYYNLSSAYAKHSGDILNGRNGAAEYIDINMEKAHKAGARYVLMNANVYSGQSFSEFPCHVGVMIRDGQTGKHFEVSTVESKLSLDSDTRNTSPALFDLKTGEMIYMDVSAEWAEHNNVHTKAASLKDLLYLFTNYRLYRAAFGDVFMFAETKDAEPATAEVVRDNRDEILAKLAAA